MVMYDISPPLTLDPGDWGIEWSDLIDKPEIPEAPKRELVLGAAIAAIWWLTGTKYGTHITKPIRPCLACTNGCSGYCGCRFYDKIDLDSSGGERPVIGIERVTISGVDLNPATDYGVINNRWLARTPTGTRWPVCQDEAVDPAPLEIIWKWGLTPTTDLIYNAVQPLIGQLWKAWCKEACSLDPSVVKAVQREGISFALISPGDVWKLGYTGNAMIDAACVRAHPLGPLVQQSPGFVDPADYNTTDWVKFERPTVTPS